MIVFLFNVAFITYNYIVKHDKSINPSFGLKVQWW